MKILIIGYVWPEPSSTGSGLRFLELIQCFLKQGWSVSFTSPAAPTSHSLNLQALGIATHTIDVNDDAFDDFIRQEQPDMVLFDRFMMEEQFGWRVAKHCPQALRVLETIDLHCLREARHHAHKAQRPYQAADLHNDIALREIAAIYRSDLSLLISNDEVDVLQHHFNMPSNILHLCPFMLDANTMHPNTPSFEQRQHFMTIGNFRHAPNWDAVLWLKQEIWSKIRQQLPQAELHIYGAYTPPKATALHQAKDGFIIKDRAASVDIAMQQARICLAPLRFGAGIKTKLVDAMRNGTPNITTTIGSEGMTGGVANDLPWSGEVHNDAQALADAAVHLYQSKTAWQTAQNNGFAIIQKVFNPETNGKALVQRIESTLNHLTQHRHNNFVGSMLNHHHHRSTEFMSRWITTKNKLQAEST